MKKMKKIFALLIAMVMVLSMSMVAFAEEGDDAETPAATTETVTITVNRDSSFAGTDESDGRAFTWYKVFSATYDSSVSTNASGHDNGTANVNAGGTKGISYIATSAVGTILKGEGNTWFDVQAIAGSTDYVVTWKDGVATDATTLQAAAKWLVENGAYEDSGDMDFADGKWTATVEKGYYVLSSDTGDNVIAATTDITVNEKNDYPPIDKKQKDEDNTTLVDENGDPLNVAIGDVINYEVTVKVPAAAKVDETIEVYDKITAGLTYNNDLVVTLEGSEDAVTLADGTSFSDSVWDKVITVTAANKGKTYTFTYSMTINDSALVDTGRENEAGLRYGDEYDSLPKKVEYTTYFTGVHKTDGDDATKKMAGVKFELKEDGQYFPVKKSGTYYIPDTSIVKGEDETDEAFAARVKAASEVVTDADGYIYIRGLDHDKDYTLTETETLAGYNMLKEDVDLELVEDKGTAFADYKADSYQDVENNKGTVLPSTGGIGTTIFYVIGAILVIGAGVVLVTRRRMNAQ